jgi:hypothetical protein
MPTQKQIPEEGGKGNFCGCYRLPLLAHDEWTEIPTRFIFTPCDHAIATVRSFVNDRRQYRINPQIGPSHLRLHIFVWCIEGPKALTRKALLVPNVRELGTVASKPPYLSTFWGKGLTDSHLWRPRRRLVGVLPCLHLRCIVHDRTH